MSRELNFDYEKCEEYQYYGDGLKFGYQFLDLQDELLAEAEDFDKLVETVMEQFSETSGKIICYYFDEGTLCAEHHGLDNTWTYQDNVDASKIARYELDDGAHIPSVNAEYIPVRRGRSVQKTLSTWGRKYKDILRDQSEFTEFDGWMDGIREAGHEKRRKFRLRFEMVIFFSHQFNSRDVTNCIKITEDSLAKHVVGVDDQYNVEVPLTKYCNRDKDAPERIYIRATILQSVWDKDK